MPSSTNRLPQPSQEHDAWLRRLAEKYHLPRATLARQVCARGALEYEIAVLIVDAATRRAYELFAADAEPPTGADLFDRAVRGVHTRLVTERERAEEEERQRRYAESDAELARIRREQQR